MKYIIKYLTSKAMCTMYTLHDALLRLIAYGE